MIRARNAAADDTELRQLAMDAFAAALTDLGIPICKIENTAHEVRSLLIAEDGSHLIVTVRVEFGPLCTAAAAPQA